MLSVSSFSGTGVLERLARRRRWRPLAPWQRAAAVAALAWVPPVLASLVDPAPAEGSWRFAHDLAAAVRLLAIVPLLVLTDRAAGVGVAAAIAGWVRAGIVPPARRGRFLRAVAVTRSLWGSRRTEWATLLLAYMLAAAEVGSRAALHPHAWLFAAWRGAMPELSLAGWWYVLVSAPLFYLVLVRWMWRYLLWVALLMRLASLPARARPGHPDGVGGLSSVAFTHAQMTPLALAMSLVQAGGCANLIAHGESSLHGLQLPALLLVAASLVLFVGPPLVFAPLLARRRRGALYRYGSVMAAYIDDLDLEVSEIAQLGPLPRRAPSKLVMGHAQLVASFQAVARTRVALLDRGQTLVFVLAAAAPLLLAGLAALPLWRGTLEHLQAALL